jgi:hypothetical protein
MTDNLDQPALLQEYRAAVDRLPVLTRVVFILSAAHDITLAEISRRFSIHHVIVQDCLAEALFILATILDGGTPGHRKREGIAIAEAALLRRYRASRSTVRQLTLRMFHRATRKPDTFEQWLFGLGMRP